MEAEKFARRAFRGAAVYGAIVLTPLLFQPTPAGARIEINLGFIGLALVFQGVFWTIGGDPVKYRALMPFAVAEKQVFGLPTLLLLLRGYPVPAPVAGFAAIDVLLGLGFFIAWRRTVQSD